MSRGDDGFALARSSVRSALLTTRDFDPVTPRESGQVVAAHLLPKHRGSRGFVGLEPHGATFWEVLQGHGASPFGA